MSTPPEATYLQVIHNIWKWAGAYSRLQSKSLNQHFSSETETVSTRSLFLNILLVIPSLSERNKSTFISQIMLLFCVLTVLTLQTHILSPEDIFSLYILGLFTSRTHSNPSGNPRFFTITNLAYHIKFSFIGLNQLHRTSSLSA